VAAAQAPTKPEILQHRSGRLHSHVHKLQGKDTTSLAGLKVRLLRVRWPKLPQLAVGP
jgi:hypothetical protein